MKKHEEDIETIAQDWLREIDRWIKQSCETDKLEARVELLKLRKFIAAVVDLIKDIKNLIQEKKS